MSLVRCPNGHVYNGRRYGKVCPYCSMKLEAESGDIKPAGFEPLVEILEEDLGMPVITSHQASLWACLRHSRINDKLPGLGKLFTI